MPRSSLFWQLNKNFIPDVMEWVSHSGWVEVSIACDKYVVADGESLYWHYENTGFLRCCHLKFNF